MTEPTPGSDYKLDQFERNETRTMPIATYGFLAIVAVNFGVQAWLGLDSVPATIRLGVLDQSLVLQGEWWRVMAAATLHGGVQHVLFNSFVLFVLGSALERLIGSQRLLVLLFASIIGGAMLSLVTLNYNMSLGASGGLWGVLAAHAILAFHPGGLIPKSMVRGARVAALINLGLNVAVSFMPNVDWAAHLGGFIVGGLLFYFVLRKGLPHFDSQTQSSVHPRVASGPITACAVVLGTAFVASLACVWILGRPFEIAATPSFKPHRDQILNVSMRVPESLSASIIDGKRSFGILMKDPTQCTVERDPVGNGPVRQSSANTTEQWLGVLTQLPRGARGASRPSVKVVRGVEVTTMTFVYLNDLRVQRALRHTTHGTFLVECAWWLSYPQWADTATQLAGSLQPLP
jgi:membrane associated rhomboid family serine protease